MKRALIAILVFAFATAAFASTQVKRVAPKTVCMINDAAMGKDQIPVQVGKQTYYGCCAMCKERLAKDATSRFAIDPVSKKKVDKAVAVIGAQPDGKVVYFENAKNLAAYNRAAGR
jgi:YHS domain-containing protein